MKLLILFLLVSCNFLKVEEFKFAGATMGTTYHLTFKLKGLGHRDFSQILQDVEGIFKEVSRQMSTYDKESLISQFNRAQAPFELPLPAEFSEVMNIAFEVYVKTDGRFDPTVMPLVEFFGFGPSGQKQVMPINLHSEQQVYLSMVGLRQLTWNPPILKKNKTHQMIDLSAIAKGYAVDLVGRYFEKRGIFEYFVEVGGEVRVGKKKESGELWRVGIEVPDPTKQGAISQVLEGEKMSVATSGDYRNFKHSPNGEIWSHLIDPKTGYPARTSIKSVTVVAPECLLADAYATALSVTTVENALKLAESDSRIEVMLMEVVEGGGIKTHLSSGFKKYLKQ